MLTDCSVLNPYNITKPVFSPAPSTTKKRALSTGAIIGISIVGVLAFLCSLTGAFLYRRRSKKMAAAELTGNVIPIQPMPSKKKPTMHVSDKPNRSHRDASSRETDRSRHNSSKRTSTTKTSQRTSQSSYDKARDIKARDSKAREKARVEAEVRRVVGEQLDAFRRSGYIDVPTSPPDSNFPPIIATAAAVEMDAGPAVVRGHSSVETESDASPSTPSLVGRHELAGGEVAMPVIEEAQTEVATVKKMSRASTRASVLDRR